MEKSTYMGIQTWKNPIDFWVYQELIFKLKPDVIVEIGIHKGGSSLAFAHLLDRNEKGRLIGIDISLSKVDSKAIDHPRVSMIEGDAVLLFERVRDEIPEGTTVLVIEDSSHEYENTLALLRTYGQLVTLESYFIVEDGICHHGLDIGPNPGPYEAARTFVQENSSFQIDRTHEDFLVTWNPSGYLKKIR